MHELIPWLVNPIGAMGYPGIFLLMAMESSVFPVPSELVMPPAGYLAQQGVMNPWVAIFAGSVGSLAGMTHLRFSAYTLLGATLWCSILTWIGYAIGRNQEMIVAYSRNAVLWV